MEKEKEICAAVRGYLSAHKITMKMVADRLGVSSGAVTNQLAGRQFSAKMAARYSEQFGFSERYLLFGEGTLFGEEKPAPTEDVSALIQIVKSQQDTIAALVHKLG